MDFLTDQECAVWAAEHGIPLAVRPQWSALESAGYHSVRFEIPSDAGRRIALARLLWEAATPYPGEALLWITEWGVWASGEHMPLARQLRERFGEDRLLKEAPGHVFAAGEDDVALSFLVIALLFLWDAWLITARGEVAIFMSHDEYGIVLARSADAWLPIEQRLAAFRGPAA